MSPRTISILKWSAAILLLSILGALFGWYLFLRTATAGQTNMAQERGFNSNTPSFTGGTGSTDANISVSLSPETAATTSGSVQAQASGKLLELSKEPVAGAAFTGSSTVTYVAQPTGYVFSAQLLTGRVDRLTNTLRPKVYLATVAATQVIEQTLDGGAVTTFLGHIASSSTSTVGTLNGGVHFGAVLAIAPDLKNGRVAYLIPGDSGTDYLMEADWSGANGKRLAVLPGAAWRLTVLPNGTVMVVEKASDNVAGYAYIVNGGGALTEIANGPGLTAALSLSGATLYGTAANGSLALYVKTAPGGVATPLPFATFAEKCVWSPVVSTVVYCAVPNQLPSGISLPDAWYQGVVHLTDTIWRFDTATGAVAKVYDPAGDNLQLDVAGPQISTDGTRLLFTDAADGSLWVLKLK